MGQGKSTEATSPNGQILTQFPYFSLCPSVSHARLCPQVWRFSDSISPKRKRQSLAKGLGKGEELVAQLLRCRRQELQLSHTQLSNEIPCTQPHTSCLHSEALSLSRASRQVGSISVSVNPSGPWVGLRPPKLPYHPAIYLPLMSVKISCLLLSSLQVFYCLRPKIFLIFSLLLFSVGERETKYIWVSLAC